MKNINDSKEWNAPIICFIVFLIVIMILFLQFCYIGLSKKVYGINMREFASNRNTVTSVLTAKRGTIYDIEGNVLAQNVSSYTLIAYLDPSRTVDDSDPKHVVDKEYTASKIASVLGEENKEYILSRLSKKSKQVEFGSIGKNITELTKIAIEELDLPGISFNETIKRYYPNGNFSSYVIGYAKQYERINIKQNEVYDLYSYYKNYFDNYDNVIITNSDKNIVSIENKKITGLKIGNSILEIKTDNDILSIIYVNVTDYDIVEKQDTTIVGELGIESNYEDKLQGKDGYIKYQQDKYGYKIPDTPETKVDAVDGSDIYLTIDSNIQRFAENAISEIKSEYEPDWAIATVMNAKTGEIYASATTPSFNPNSLSSDMSYQNPLVSYSYEPGSVMKIYSYLCAIETGNYDGSKEYLSGSYKFSDGTIMHDWDKNGWGKLSYDSGFSYSSNIAVINIINDYLSSKKLSNCLKKYGFGEKTGIELSGEVSGSVKFSYETEVMAAGFGQGISTTVVQQLQALTIIANDGQMVKPHIIKKIISNNNDEVLEETVVNKSEKIVSSSSIKKIKELMLSVIQPDGPTGGKYYLEGYDLIGKTGTAQIYENGKYLDGANDYIVSVALMYPKDDPEIIIYMAVKKPSHNANSVLIEPTKELIKNISKYKVMLSNDNEKSILDTIVVENYSNKTIENIEEKLKNLGLEVVRIGSGEKIINQYPLNGSKLTNGDKIFLVTNNNEYKMLDLTNWSRSDVKKYCELLNIKCEFEGSGYVINQSIKVEEIIKDESKLKIELGNIKIK